MHVEFCLLQRNNETQPTMGINESAMPTSQRLGIGMCLELGFRSLEITITRINEPMMINEPTIINARPAFRTADNRGWRVE